MHDDQQIKVIDDAFAAFRGGGPLGPPLGAEAAHATVKHRKRMRVIAAGAVAAVAVVAPVAVYAMNGPGGKQRPPVGNTVEPSTQVSSPPSALPSNSPTAPPTAPLDGRVTANELASATVDFRGVAEPTLCPTGTFTFKGATTARNGVRISITKVLDLDFDRDGGPESIALITCAVQGADHAVLALDRAADGSIVTAGVVVSTSEKAPIKAVFDIRADVDGAVGVQVGNTVERQWRSYGYEGQRFRQVGGPTNFSDVPAASDLSVTGTDLALGAPSGDARRGSITVTVKNNGPKAAPGAVVTIAIPAPQSMPAPIQIDADLNDCTRSTNQLRCRLNGFANGESRTYTFRFTSPVANDPYLSFGGQHFSATIVEEQPGGRLLYEADASNNQFTGQITLSN
jgi:hypothetical protein